MSSTGKMLADSIITKRAVRPKIRSRIRAVVSGSESTRDAHKRSGWATPRRRGDGREKRLWSASRGLPGGQLNDAE